MQDIVITTSLVITRSVWGSGTIVNPRSSSGVILSVEATSLVLVLEELVRDPLEITADSLDLISFDPCLVYLQ